MTPSFANEFAQRRSNAVIGHHLHVVKRPVWFSIRIN
jgi:hypothetical protein